MRAQLKTVVWQGLRDSIVNIDLSISVPENSTRLTINDLLIMRYAMVSSCKLVLLDVVERQTAVRLKPLDFKSCRSLLVLTVRIILPEPSSFRFNSGCLRVSPETRF